MATEEADIYFTFLTGLGIFTLLLVVCGLSIFRHLRRRKRWLRAVALRDIAMVEEERRRISADLHDDFGSVLASVRLGLDSLKERYPDDAIVPRTLRHLDISLGRLREISHNLVPKILQQHGICAALEQLCEEINAGEKLRIALECQIVDSGFDKDKSLILFRVIQEIITNAIKHASPTVINILLHESAGKLFLEISDDGTGFDYQHALANSRSFGLQNVRSRLNVLEGILQVVSSAGKGTLYKINLPIPILIAHGNNRQNQDHRSR